MIKMNSIHSTHFNDFSTPMLINEIKTAKDDVELKWGNLGGSTPKGQEFIRFIQEHPFKISADVSGMVASMGAYSLAFLSHVKGAEQADLMIHSPFSGGDVPTEHTMQFFYDSLKDKINEGKFAEITGHQLRDVIFAQGDNRKNIWITGKQAGEIGFFKETYSLLDKAANLDQVNIPSNDILGFSVPPQILQKYAKVENIIIPNKTAITNKNNMELSTLTKEALMAGNPALFAEIEKTAKLAEQKRLSFVNKYAKYDDKLAQEIIESGNEMTMPQLEHFMEKKAGLTKVADLEQDSNEDFTPARKVATVPPVNLTKEQKEAKLKADEKEASLNGVRDELGTTQFLANIEKK